MMITPTDRAVILETCAGHAVAYCERCRDTFEFGELGEQIADENGDPVGCDQEQPGTCCPRCGEDLGQTIAEHLNVCPHYAARSERGSMTT